MENRILVPLDGSELAEAALPHASAIARATSRGLTLLRVVPPIVLIDPIGGVLGASSAVWEVWEQEPVRARDYLASVAGRPDYKSSEVETQVLEGDPASIIVEYAEQHLNVEMIIMSTHGTGGLRRWLMGSVSEKVLHASPVPLMMVRPEERSAKREDVGTVAVAYNIIVVPLDGSPFAEEALEQARELAVATGAELALISVATTPFDLVLSQQAIETGWSAVPWDEQTKRLTTYLDTVVARLDISNLRLQSRVTYGDPTEEIVKFSKEVGADLIVMATHGLGGLRRFLIGSTAMKVVHESPVPVLLVRPGKRATER